LSGPKQGANSFGVASIIGIVRVRGNDPLDFDSGYHVINTFIILQTMHIHVFPIPIPPPCQGTLIITIRNINDEKPQFE
ncbi:unnamed protein product, partial [Rangifer tarandus platyrhynchus]